MFDSLLPNVISWAGILLMALGALMVFGVRAAVQAGETRRVLPGILLVLAGLTLHIAALWIHIGTGGNSWIPGAIIATAVWGLSVGVLIRNSRRLFPRDHAKADERD